jgi:cytochrome bd ubiquinol oxidase subunit I
VTLALAPLVAAAAPSQLLPAREQMAFTLGFHILLVPIGVALPAIMLIANYKGLRKNDEVALTLARRWSHAAAVTFAVGAASGTVLSFELGLLWPGLTGKFGDVFGLPFMIEGIAFFLEAIFITIYIFGWKRLRPWTHFWLGVPIPFIAAIGVFSIIAANSWMNAPSGFTIGKNGLPTNIDPGAAIFNDMLPYEFAHMILAAYLTCGFVVASIYVVGWLRGRRDRYHRLGILIPLTVAAIATPLQFMAGDTIARQVFQQQPVKFAAMEIVTESGAHQPEYLFGRYDSATNTVKGGIKIPGLDSYLAGGSTSTYVNGLEKVSPDDRPSNVTLVHWAFDIMVGIATLFLAIVAWFAIAYWRRRDVPKARIFLWAAACSGVLAYIALESGWITTEVGRQPWIVYNVERTADAVTHSNGVWVMFVLVLVVYTLMAIGTVTALRIMSRRWKREDVDDALAPYGPRPDAERVLAGSGRPS